MEELERALDGDAEAIRSLVRELTPVVQARVARVLIRQETRGRDGRQEVADLCQEVFLLLFRDRGRVLRTWQPARGMSLPNFVGLIATRRTLDVLRSGRRSPWTEDPTLARDMPEPAAEGAQDVEARVAARDLWSRVLDRLTERLSPKGMRLFERLLIEEQPVAEVAASLEMTTAAVYAWQGRLKALVREVAAELVAEPETLSERSS